MIRIYRSNCLTELAGILAGLPDFTSHPDPFYSPEIVVPNLDTSRWLKLEVAGLNGFSGNLSFMLPAEWMWNQIRVLYPNLPKKLAADPEPVTWALFDMLLDPETRKRFGILNRYIQSRPDESREKATLELAKMISSLFDQYQIYRPEMLMAWQNGKSGIGSGSGAPKGEERWQAELWNDLNTWLKSHFDENDVRSLNRAELYNKAIQAMNTGRLKLQNPLFVFNPGLIPKPIVELMGEVAKHQSVYLFLIQPSPEPTREDSGNPMVSSLGGESGAVSKLYEFSEAESESTDHFKNRSSSGLLARIQDSIASNEPLTGQPGSLSGTVAIRSCHSRNREVEALHDFLLEKFQDDDTLNPEDVLVVTPDLLPYASAIHSVFGTREPGLPEIPYHLAAGESEEAAMLRRTFILLIDIPDSRFEFNKVMELFLMKPVHERFGLSLEDAFRVQSWVDENHVHWGMDPEHRKEWNQPANSDRHTWQSAVRRVWLGYLMAVEAGEVSGNTLLYTGVRSSSDYEIWAAFTAFLNRLNQIRIDAGKTVDPASWCNRVEQWINHILSEGYLQSSHSQFIYKLLRDVRESAETASFRKEVNFGLMQQWMKKKLSAYGTAGAQFNRGVTFSTMVPVRSIPFRVIALIGLNEGVFPRRTGAPDFDLMLQYPDPSDRNRRNEDRNLFLESVLAAVDIHYTSYIGRSHIDNEPLPPSPVVSEWISFLSNLIGLTEDDIVLRVPLTGYSATAFSAQYSAWSDVHFRTAKAFQGISTGANGLYSGNRLPPYRDVDNEYVDLGKMVSRVVHPLRGFVRDRMNAALSDPDEEKQEFEINALERHRIFDRLFKWRLHNREEIDFEQVVWSSGILPAGRPGVMELNELILAVDRAVEAIRKSGFEPEMNHMDVDITTGEFRIQGEIQSYSARRFLDLSASSRSAVNMLQTWVRHLLLSAMYPDKENESALICELKKDPVIVTYAAVNDPEKYLEPLVNLFTDSGEKPVLFFPKTVMAYVENLEKGEDAARKKAALEFEGTGFDYSWPERDDLNSAVMLGSNAELTDEMLDERFCGIISGMLKHTVEG